VRKLSKEQLRIAIIGIGKQGLLHASLLNTIHNAELVALCDKSASIRKLCKRLLSKVQVVDDLSKLASSDIDAVYVTTPTPSHASVVKTIYAGGIAQNVFVEKPLASSYVEASQLHGLAQDSRGINMVGYMKRFAVTFRKAKNLLDEDYLGTVISFDAYGYSSDFSEIEKGSKMPALRGGVLADLGCHVIDLALWFFGDLKVETAKLESLDMTGSEDSASFSVTRPDGVTGRFDTSWCKPGYRMPEVGLWIKGSKGTMKVNDDSITSELVDGTSSIWYRHDLDDAVDFLLGAPEYYREDECFVRSALSASKTEPSFYTSSKVDWLIDQVKVRAGKHE
jgi:predicted dehydrogenase